MPRSSICECQFPTGVGGATSVKNFFLFENFDYNSIGDNIISTRTHVVRNIPKGVLEDKEFNPPPFRPK